CDEGISRKVEENLRVNFLENKPNVAGQGPKWLFDIDSLTNSMNYQPVTAGNQTNKYAGPQKANGNTDEKYKNDTADDAAGESPVQKPENAVRKEFEAQCNKEVFQGKATRASNTNSFNTVSTLVNAASAPRTSNDAGPSFVPLGESFPLIINDLPDDPLMPNLENTAEVQNTSIFCSAYDDDDLDTYNSPYADQVMGAEADFNNMELSTVVSLIPTTRVHFIHPKNQIIRYPRIEAIRLFLAYASFMNFVVYQMDVKSAFLYGTIDEEVYVSQPLGFVDPKFPEKVYKVEKALYGLHQAPRAWGDILPIQVYVDDIIFGSTKKSLCTDFEQIMHKRFQMSLMGELTFFLGLQVKQKEDGIFISQDKYVGEILKKFGFSSIRTTSTPMETNKALTKDEDGKDVDIHLYRSMIGSLMYLTSSRPDIMFSVCACSRFQVQPKVSHLNAVKRIFRYLKGRPNLGLWYPKDSPFILEAFSDSDYAGASLDKKSTIREGGGDSVERPITTTASLDAAQDSDKIIRTQTTTMPNVDIPQGMDTSGSPRRQDTIGGAPTQNRAITPAASLDAAQDSDNIIRNQTMAMPNVDIPQGIDTGGSPRSEDTMGVLLLRLDGDITFELRLMYQSHPMIHLSREVLDLEKEKDVQAVEILRIENRVKRLEKQRKSSTSQPRRRKYKQVKSLDDNINEEDASKHGRSNDKTK
ncbi:putative ribonuclease H-like domain-containing protein, partial [Tanacetum coccineum]